MSPKSPSKTGSDLTLAEVIAVARDNIALFADMPVDQVVSCKRAEDHWLVEMDLVEAPARLGDNDLIATYAMTISYSGQVLGIERMRRYTREDLGASSA